MANIQCIDFTKHNAWLSNTVEETLTDLESHQGDQRKKLLFLIDVNEIGENIQALSMLLDEKKKGDQSLFNHSVVALIVRSTEEKYTKSFIKRFLFLANDMGAEILGHGAVEILPDFANFGKWALAKSISKEEAARFKVAQLVLRLNAYQPLAKDALKLLVLHAGHHETSNSLMLWDKVRGQLEDRFKERISVDEIHVEEGKITDCYGCSFETCMYYALEKSCFYGGFVVEELYPKIEAADIVVWICPNYNDAVSAKLMAVINRLTALYRTISFNDKYIMGVFVSGNSGNDSVARQLIGALNVNKGFRILPHFGIMAIANEPGEILDQVSIDKNVCDYVNRLYENLYRNIQKI